jgi:Domain of unknown function (DUF4190)
MTYPPPGNPPDPYQPQQPYGQPYDPTAPYSPDPYAAPASGAPASGQPYGQQYPPTSGQPYAQQPPAYTQPYGAPGYMPAPATNTMAILALVFAFVFSPAAIVLGHVAKKQIRQTGEGGDGLATAGLWLGYIFTGLYVVGCGLWLVLVIIGVTSSSTTSY